MRDKRKAYVLGLLSAETDKLNYFPTEYDVKRILGQLADRNDLVAEILKEISSEEICNDWWWLEDWLSE